MVKHDIQAKVALLVTDNAANMLKARRLTIESVGFKHILEMRWAVLCLHGTSFKTTHPYACDSFSCCDSMACAVV